ncbi:hypothetical protein ES703_58077 [subsurface metagenome]
MKLSRRAWIILLAGIFIIGLVSINTAYSKQDEERSRLNQELAVAQARLAQYAPEQDSVQVLASQQEELESQLVQIETQLKSVKADLAPSIQSIEVTDTLFKVAESCGVEITEIGSPGLNDEALEGLNCSVLMLTVKAEGSVLKLVNFILGLSDEFPTGVVEAVEINVPLVTEEEEGTENPSANLELHIHTYEGD